MNKQRRKELQEALDHLEMASDIVSGCASDEQTAFDNLPESFQWTEDGERMEEVAADLEEAADLIMQSMEIVSNSM